jgi:putative ABC transport system permease protein
MIRNYLKVAFRNLIKNKVSSFVNIIGLSTGMAVAILIALSINSERSFNTYHKNYDRIGQVLIRTDENGTKDVNRTMPLPLAPALRSTYSNDFESVVMSTETQEHILASGDVKIAQKGRFMEADAPDMLTLTMLRGSRKGLASNNTMLISASLAHILFGKYDPIGKTIKIDNNQDVTVTGVYEDIPKNSQFRDVSYLAPWNLFIGTRSAGWLNKNRSDWNNNFLHVYVLLAGGTDFEKVSRQIKDLKRNNVNKADAAKNPEVFILPMSKWHMYGTFENGIPVVSRELQSVRLYTVIGIFVLLLACINFMNLSTARSQKRAKEVGIRKSIGSLRGQLIVQFFAESLLLSCIAFACSLLLVLLILPWFNKTTDNQIGILWNDTLFWLACIAFTVITGILAGSYPAFYLSSFNPVQVLKGNLTRSRTRAGSFASIPRRILVVVQFTFSITLVICTVVVLRQVRFSKDRPMGYDSKGLIYINMRSADIYEHQPAFRGDLLKTAVVDEVAESDGTINELWANSTGINWPTKNLGATQQMEFGTIGVSQGFGKTVGWQFTDGRDFLSGHSEDSGNVIVNEAAVNYMGLKRPVGSMIQRDRNNFTIIGVIKDVVMESPYNPVTPTIFFLGTWNKATVNIKIKPGVNTTEAISKIGSVFKQYAPGMPFDYIFADSEYAAKFSNEERAGKLTAFFAILAIIISCLGLFGLASFVAEQRTKEIGVRRVMGASVFDVWRLLTSEFVLPVAISFLISAPCAYFFMHNWLQNYEYRAEIAWWIFLLTGSGTLIITLATVSFQSIRAAFSNPVDRLRAE